MTIVFWQHAIVGDGCFFTYYHSILHIKNNVLGLFDFYNFYL